MVPDVTLYMVVLFSILRLSVIMVFVWDIPEGVLLMQTWNISCADGT